MIHLHSCRPMVGTVCIVGRQNRKVRRAEPAELRIGSTCAPHGRLEANRLLMNMIQRDIGRTLIEKDVLLVPQR